MDTERNRLSTEDKEMFERIVRASYKPRFGKIISDVLWLCFAGTLFVLFLTLFWIAVGMWARYVWWVVGIGWELTERGLQQVVGLH